jgi:lipopolysaccharide export LptBFGC system permease protein LptF
MARQLTLYELGETGLPETRLDARVASYVGHERWRLLDSHQTIVGSAGLIQTTSPEVKRISSIESLAIDPMHEDLRGLARHIRESQQSGYDLTAFQVDFQSRLAAPLQCLILPWLGLVVALGVRKAAPTLLAALGIGVGFILLSGVSAALGYGGWLPPVVAGWLPSGAVASAAAALQLRR